MTARAIVLSVLTLIAGVGVFLTACNMLGENLQALGGTRLKRILQRTADRKLVGVGVGAAVTAVIQSSGATTAIVIGLVDSGLMTVFQAATVIYGANVGTTITGQLVALGLSGSGGISATAIFAAFTGIGAFISACAKRDGVKRLGGAITGFGLIFFGLGTVGGAMNGLAELDRLKNFIAAFDNGFVLIIVGVIVTAAVQSSSVTTSVTITMLATGLITLDQGIHLAVGANVGTCVTAFIAGLGGKNAKRAALIHLLFNSIGCLVFIVAEIPIKIFGLSFGELLSRISVSPQIALATFHTIFNVATVIIILPFTDKLVKRIMRN